MARASAPRINVKGITDDLRIASRKGDGAALGRAVDQMKILALSPRYWEKYLGLLRHPLARLVDLLVIKQGQRIAHQKGWKKLPGAAAEERRAPAASHPTPSRGRSRDRRGSSKKLGAGRGGRPSATQPSLFD